MQVIWSRAAQTSSCRCNVCLHSASKLARRTTTAVSKRQFKPSDVFTLCYSAMFATAAVLEAKRKDGRRKKWDKAIEEAKTRSGSGSVGKSTAAVDWAVKESRMCSPAVDQTSGNVATAAFGTPGQIPQSTEFLPPVLNSKERDLSKMNKAVSADKGILAMEADIQRLPAVDEVWDEEMDQAALDGRLVSPKRSYRLSPREPRKKIHLDCTARMASKLVQKLFEASEISSPGLSVSQHNSPEIRIDRRPKYAPISQQILRERMALNVSIEAVLTENLSDDVTFDMIIAKVCYMLLSSNAPPNIVTYNLMLVHFTRLGQHRHAQTIVDSLLNDSQFRPNSRTISAVLDHYTATKRTVDFQKFTKRMRAMDGDMRIRRVHTSLLHEPKIQAWAEKWKATHHNSFLYAKVHRDSMVFESLIRGAIQLFELKWAVMYFQFAIQEGCHITIDLFCYLARTCFHEGDKRRAAKILSAIVSRWYETNGPPLFEGHGGGRKRIYKLLELCGVSPSKALVSYEPQPKGLPDVRAMRPWLYCLRIESISREVALVSEIISNLEIMVSKYLLGDSAATRIRRHVQQHLTQRFENASKKKNRLIVESLGKAVYSHAHRLESLMRQFVGVVYQSLSLHDREIYDGLKRSNQCLDASEVLKIIVDLSSDSHSTSYRSLGILSDPSGSYHSASKAKRSSLRTRHPIFQFPDPSTAVKSFIARGRVASSSR